MADHATPAAAYRVAEIIVRGGDLIGFSVMKPQPGGEEAAFLVSRHGSSAIAKRFAQTLRVNILPAGVLPRYLDRAQAAAYLGVGIDTFDAEVRDGWWPAARPRGGKGGRLTWDRVLLDAAADQVAGIGPVSVPAPHMTDINSPSLVERIHATASRKRPERRP